MHDLVVTCEVINKERMLYDGFDIADPSSMRNIYEPTTVVKNGLKLAKSFLSIKQVCRLGLISVGNSVFFLSMLVRQ